ncbi:MAG: hypothetical protein QXM22_04090 [Candidatus Bathyarchaeia archaeon]
MKKAVLRAITAFACFLFLVSIFCPFLSIRGVSMIPEIKFVIVSFWSFRVTHEYQWRLPSEIITHGEEYWFDNYWRYVRIGYSDVEAGVMILMFMTQILTVAFAMWAASLRRVKAFWFLLPAIYSAVTVFGMGYISQANTSLGQPTKLETGFWLTSISLVIFIGVFFTSSKWIPRQKQHNMT